MSLETNLYAALQTLVSGRCYPVNFPQVDSGTQVWPAIRYTFTSTVPVEDLCGDGDDETADVSVQLDGVAKTYSAMRALRLAIMAEMRTFAPPARLGVSFDEYDAETKTFRVMLDYMVSGSSDAPVDSPP